MVSPRRRFLRPAVAFILAWCGLCAPASAEPQPPAAPAELILVNARIWPGAGPDGAAPTDWTALAVAGGRIIDIGRDEQIRKLQGPGTTVIDAGGRRLIPGLTDSHVHLISGGLGLSRLNLRTAPDRAAFVAAVAAESRRLGPGEWVVGGRWSVDSWDDASPPHRSWIDGVTGDRPALLTRMDGHQALANSAALALAGIDAAGPPDPKGGEIERDPVTREPTGILKESAIGLVGRHEPPTSADRRYEALRAAMAHFHSFGITSVHDMAEPDDLPVYARAAREGILTLRVHVYLNVSDWKKHLDTVTRFADPTGMVRIHGFKGFMDGSLGSRTAYMREPFSDAAATAVNPRGLLDAMVDPFEAFVTHQVKAIEAAGLQMAVHAIGDEANHLILDAFEAARRQSGRDDARHRVEHAQHLLREDIPRFGRLGVVASMQPFHKADDGRYAAAALGEGRSQWSYAFRPVLEAGGVLAFGSDWPVVTCDPFAGIAAAVTSRTLGKDDTLSGPVWMPHNAISVEQALTAYTAGPAWAVHNERNGGRLRKGTQADFVILSEDILAAPPERLHAVQAVQTFMGGKKVYSR
jgi:predicted amidohydrolase YtcJ